MINELDDMKIDIVCIHSLDLGGVLILSGGMHQDRFDIWSAFNAILIHQYVMQLNLKLILCFDRVEEPSHLLASECSVWILAQRVLAIDIESVHPHHKTCFLWVHGAPCPNCSCFTHFFGEIRFAAEFSMMALMDSFPAACVFLPAYCGSNLMSEGLYSLSIIAPVFIP